MLSPSTNLGKQLEAQGFLQIPHLLEPADLLEVRNLLDPLFEKFRALPASHRLDLAPGSNAAPRIPDINRALALEPRLRRTKAFRSTRALAGYLIGGPVWCTFDHAIYKPGQQSAETPWHQDQAYAATHRVPRSVHLWLPLQDATEDNGCMWFVPGSHRWGMQKHSPVSESTATLRLDDPREADARSAPVPAGGVTAHLPLTFHRAGPNHTTEVRRAWILHFTRFGHLGQLHPANLWFRLRRSRR